MEQKELKEASSLARLRGAQLHADGGRHPARAAFCSVCGRSMDGHARIFMEQPPMVCHQECFKCKVCGLDLGNMMTPMFLRGQQIHCKSCYLDALYR